MYSTALYKNPTQTVDSSKCLERRFSNKQQNVIKKLTKGREKKTKRQLEQNLDFLSWLLTSKRIFSWLKKNLPDEPSSLYAHMHKKDPWKKWTIHFERFNYVDTDSTFHNTT